MNTSNVTHESARRGWFFVRLLDCLFRPFYWVDRPVGSRRKLSYIWPEQCSKIRLELAIPCCPRYLKVNHWNLGMICFALMAEVFVLRAVCFGKGYGALKWQKQKTNEQSMTGVYCYVEDDEFGVEVKNFPSCYFLLPAQIRRDTGHTNWLSKVHFYSWRLDVLRFVHKIKWCTAKPITDVFLNRSCTA